MDISYYKKCEPIFGSWHIVREIGDGADIEAISTGVSHTVGLKFEGAVVAVRLNANG